MPVSIFKWQRSCDVPRRRGAFSSARAAAGVETVGVRLMIEDAVEIADAEGAEHQDRQGDARRPQRDAFFDVGAREHRRARALERASDFRRAMSVGVGFEDRDDIAGAPGRPR